MAITHKTFPRGYRFQRFVGQPSEDRVDLPVPAVVRVPLRQGRQDALTPVVEAGESVRAGAVIARNDDGIAGPAHASVNGVVTQIVETDLGDGPVQAVEIESDGTDAWEPLEGHAKDWQALPAEIIEKLLYESGAASLARDGVPTRFRSSPIAPDEVEDLIVAAAESEMFNASPGALLQGDGARRFADGLRVLKKILPNARMHVALSRARETLARDLAAALSGIADTNVCTVEPKYPQDFEAMLVTSVLGRPFPHGYAAANIGVVILDIQAVLHAYDAVAEGKPVIERTVALCGPGFTVRPHVNARVGAPLSDLAGDRLDTALDQRLVTDSPLTGPKLDPTAPLGRTVSCVIALPEDARPRFMAFLRPGADEDAYSRTFLSSLLPTRKKASTNTRGEERPCVSCGYCRRVCPTGLFPHLLHQYLSRDILDDCLVHYGVFNCIECNLCSYVCPCKVPVAEDIREGKKKLKAEGMTNEHQIAAAFTLRGLAPDTETEHDQ